jgi:anthranilate phosphoribosyltransferase
MSIRTELRRVVEDRETLSLDQASALMQRILAGEAPDMELAALLGAMAGRGETAAEIAGFAQLLRTLATPLPLSDDERAIIVDTCGTGGDGSGTFNISTAAALVAAAAGAKVAKHGNRAAARPMSSKPSASPPNWSPPPPQTPSAATASASFWPPRTTQR